MAETWIVRNENDLFEELPTTDSIVVVKNAPNAEREYKIIEVKNSSIQMEIQNDSDIVGWQYMSYFMSPVNSNKNLLSGYKEGTENDWAPTVNGYIQVEYDIYMLRQQINARIQTLPNEVDGFDGIDYMNVIFANTSVEQKAAALVEVIQNIPAVKNVTFINAAWVNKEQGVFQFTFNIQSIFGDLTFQLGLDAQNKKVIAQN